MGLSAALKHFKREQIHCIEPKKYTFILSIFYAQLGRINVASKISHVCFDKTGTLTEDGLCVYSVVVFSDQQAHILQDFSQWPADASLLFKLMLSCHQLRILEGKVIGDPLDIEMFYFTGCHTLSLGPSGIFECSFAHGDKKSLVFRVFRIILIL